MQPTASPTPPAPSLLARIRSATQAHHQRAESLAGLPHSLADHVQTLKTFYGFIEPWELQVSKTLLPLQTQLQDRRKTPLLLADLQALGVSHSELAALPKCERLPMIHDVPTALGSMYVFEGATLGGQLLSRHVENELGLANGNGYSFYRSYGANVGLMWREFRQLLTEITPPTASDAVIRSAQETFDRLCDFFEDFARK